jgi:MFS superfamily sulfate permease-like transporter
VQAISRYQFVEDFRYDFVAGISVAAVALPVSIAYAQLAGFNPVVGLYSSVLPLVAYAIFGTSRQLIVNPDAAVCAMIASAIGPLAAGLYLSLTISLTFLTGLLCIAASFFRVGALADFLSRPIPVGFLNGIAISIFLGQRRGEYAQEGRYVRWSKINRPVHKPLTATLLLGFWLCINFAAPIAVSIVSRQD